MAAAFALPAYAVDWRFAPSVSGYATYTDNANQSESNPEDALILGVTPGFTLRSEGSRRVQASLQYGLSGVARFGEDQSTDLNHNLGAVGKAELVEDFLFIDGTARISQELISLTGSPASADINDSNRATVGTYSISPYIQKRLGTFANAQARYTTSGAIFENDVAANSNVNAFSAGLTSGSQFNDLSWGLNYSIRKAENKDADDTTFESAGAQLGYALTRKFRVFGTVGQDWNDYLSTSGTDGSSYSVGFGWSPTRRTSIEASAGERYFGKTFSFSGSHRTRLSRWTVRYSEDVSDITQALLDQSDQLYFVCAAVPHFPPAADFVELPPPGCTGPYPAGALASVYRTIFGVSATDLLALGFPSSIARGVFIVKTFTAGVSWNVGRLGYGLSAQDTKRLYQELGDAQDHVQGLTGSVSYRLSPKTTANSSLSLTRNSLDSAVTSGSAREDDILNLNLGLNHTFAQDLSGALNFRHTQRDSNAVDSDYAENSLTASVNMRF
jgi:uncharacterized protein (PEP-CTERM system associated)